MLTSYGRISERVELFTPLPPPECARRLSSAIDDDGWLWLISLRGLVGSKPVIGHVTETWLRLRKRIGYRNSFQTILSASLRPEGGGTLIHGTAGVHVVVRAFMFVWFGGVMLGGGAIFLGTLAALLFGSGPRPPNAWAGIVMPWVMLGFGIGLVAGCRYLARDETRFLTDFLDSTLGAQQRE